MDSQRIIDGAIITFTAGAVITKIDIPDHRPTAPISTLKSNPWVPNPNSSSTDQICPVCTCEIDPDDFFKTDCGHAYCGTCFEQQCSGNGSEFPLRCLSVQGTGIACGQLLSLADLERGLSSSALDSLYKAAAKQHIGARKKNYRYCVLPECSHLNRLAPWWNGKGYWYCQGCKECMCLTCEAPAHYGKSCAESSGQDDAWKAEVGAKDCPNCKTVTIKDYGCFHMECETCKAHYCWECLQIFATADETYGHMSQAHTDWGLPLRILWEVPNLFPRLQLLEQQFRDQPRIARRFARMMELPEAADDTQGEIAMPVQWRLEDLNYEGINMDVLPADFRTIFIAPANAAMLAFTALIAVEMLVENGPAVPFLHRNRPILDEVERFLAQNAAVITAPEFLSDDPIPLAYNFANLNFDLIAEYLPGHWPNDVETGFVQLLEEMYEDFLEERGELTEFFQESGTLTLAFLLEQFRAQNEEALAAQGMEGWLAEMYDAACKAQQERFTEALSAGAIDFDFW